MSANQWALVLHLSQYAGFIVPLGGFIAPIVIWQVKKEDVPGLDEHGKNIANWLVSSFVYAAVCGLLTIVLIGFVGLFVIAIMAVAFPLIGALKANDGEAWKYPLTIAFFK